MITILCWILLIICIASLYANANLLKKVEKYEDGIFDFYTNAQIVLAKAREIDKKEMFEKNDDVGVIFQNLILTIGELRYILYGEEDEGTVLDDGDGGGDYRIQSM